MSKNLVKESIEQGFSFILFPKIEVLYVLVGYFAASVAVNLLMSYFVLPMPPLQVSDVAALTPAVLGMLGMRLLRLLIALPLIVYVAQRILLNADGHAYFSYFLKKETWSLFFARILMLVLIGIPSLIVFAGVYSAFIHIEGGTQLASGMALALKMLFYIVMLPTIMVVILYFIMRFLLINVHVSIGKPLDMFQMFKASEGHAWEMFVPLLVTSLPAIILFWFSSAAVLMPSALVLSKPVAALTALQPGSTLMEIVLRTVVSTLISYLLMASIAALCHLYKNLVGENQPSTHA